MPYIQSLDVSIRRLDPMTDWKFKADQADGWIDDEGRNADHDEGTSHSARAMMDESPKSQSESDK